MNVLSEIQQFLELSQQQYVEAYNANDSRGMFDASYTLARTYSAIGNLALAGRWAHECEKYTTDPAKILTINMLLLCGIIKHRYLHNN